jgi:general secretion pathway protein F
MQAADIRFHFRAYGQNGGHETGYVTAAGEAEAVRQLTQAGKVPYKITRAEGSAQSSREGGWSLSTLFQPKLDLTLFFSDLAVMLNSGFNIDIALKAVADAETNKAQKARVQSIHALITEGKSVADAFSSCPEIPADVVALIASGESSGRMDVVVSELAKSHALNAARRSEISEALLYPAFLIFVMFCALLILSLYLAPALRPIFENAGVAAPFIVRALGAFGEVIGRYGLLLAAVGALGVVLLVPLLRTRRNRARFADFFARIPVVSNFMRTVTRGRYLNTMALLLGNGVPMLEAMQLAANSASCERHRKGVMEARQRVSGGEPMWKALTSSGVFPESILSLLKLGEESNSLAPMMSRAGMMTQAQLQRRLSRLLTFLTPAITILLGAVVGGLVISVMTTLLSINEIAIR